MPLNLTFPSGERDIRLTTFEPEPTGTTTPRPAIVLLHGAGGGTDLWTERLGPILRQTNICLYAPHYFDRTGTRRADGATLTDGIHVPQWLDTVEDSLRVIARRPAVDSDRIVLAGVSLGGFLTMAVAARQCDPKAAVPLPHLRALVEISGGLVPPFDSLASSSLPPTLVIHGEADTVVPVRFARDLASKLATLGVMHRAEILPGEGHWFSAAAWPTLLMAVSSFLQSLLR